MSKIFFVLFLVSILSFTEAANLVRSSGSGPAFEISPAVVFANVDGQFQIGGFSESGTSISLSAYFNGVIKDTLDKQWTFTFTLPSTVLYSYVVFESHEGYLTSIATALVLSYDLKQGNEDFQFFPNYKGYMRGNEDVYVISEPEYGRESISLFLDGQKISQWKISPFDNSPKIFKTSVDTTKLKDGFHLFSTEENLITGQIISSNSRIGIDNRGPEVISFLGQDIFLSGKYEITVKATGTIPLKEVSLYVKNGIQNSLISTLPVQNGEARFVVNEFAGSKTFVVSVSDISGLSRSYEFTIVNNQSFIIPLVILTFTLGVILLTFLK